MTDTVSRVRTEETRASRFKMTELVIDNNALRYGLWVPPEITLDGTEQSFTCGVEHEGRPDLVSYTVYGNVNFWWAIMWVNNILFPMRDLKAGTVLIIPSILRINAALDRARS